MTVWHIYNTKIGYNSDSMFIFLYYRTDRRAAIAKGKFPSAIEIQQWTEIHKDAVL